MADLFIEVEEAMKRERLEKFWATYGNYIVTLVILTIAGTAAYAGYKAWNETVRTQQTTQFLDTNTQDDPQAMIALAPSLRPGLAAIARIDAAGDFLEQGQAEEAAKIFGDVANDNKAPKELQELAAFALARQKVASNPEQGLLALAPLYNGNGPWRYHARLEAAVILADSLHDYAAARNHLAVLLTEEDLPQSLSKKASSLDILYALKQHESGASGNGPQDIQPSADK